MPSDRRRYIPSLDGLRAIAVGFVLVTHAAHPMTLPGGFGVDVFFVLSGFLITTLLWKEAAETRTIALGRFYLRRLIRLYPALIVVLLVSAIAVVTMTGAFAIALRDTGAGLLYLTPFTDALWGKGVFTPHLWTLALEEYFYLVWPVVLIVLLRAGASWKMIAALLGAAAIALYGARFASALLRGIETHPPRVGGIALGCALALFVANSSVRGNRRVMWTAGVGGLALAFFTSFGGVLVDAATPLIAAIATAAIILAIMSDAPSLPQRILELRPLTYTGEISYELYLWHLPVIVFAGAMTGLDRNQIWWWAYPIAYLLSVATHSAFAPLQARLRRRVAESDAKPIVSTLPRMARRAG